MRWMNAGWNEKWGSLGETDWKMADPCKLYDRTG
jgi:hypothetical protein